MTESLNEWMTKNHPTVVPPMTTKKCDGNCENCSCDGNCEDCSCKQSMPPYEGSD